MFYMYFSFHHSMCSGLLSCFDLCNAWIGAWLAESPLRAVLAWQVKVGDYVPDGLSDFAEALANPIKYQSELEKRAQQLRVLTDEGEEAEVSQRY